MSTSALPFEYGDTANLGCVSTGHYPQDQHTLVIDRDEENSAREENVNVTVVFEGQPEANITVDRRALIEALGGVVLA